MTQPPVEFDPLRIPLAGVHSIAAAAGTGKTYTITTLYVRYLLETDCRVEDVLVTTFTEAATAELKDRLRARLREALELTRTGEPPGVSRPVGVGERPGVSRPIDRAPPTNPSAPTVPPDPILLRLLDQAGAWNPATAAEVQDRLRQALLDFDHAPVFTIHGFCHRVLQESVFETLSRFDLELLTSLQPLVADAVADFVAQGWTTDESALARWLPLDAGLWSTLQQVAEAAVNEPDCRVVPDHRELDDLLDTALLDEFAEAAEAFAEVWKAQRDEARELLFEAQREGWLGKGTHSEKQLREAVAFLDVLAEEPSPDAFKPNRQGELPAVQRRLTQSSLERGTKKAHQAHVPRHPVFAALEQLVELVGPIAARRAQIRPRLLARAAHTVRQHVNRRKQQQGVMSFSDLLHQVDAALAGPQQALLLARLRERYRVALVDEFQDTDPVQYRIFRKVFQDTAAGAAGGPLRAFVMIGDPKQSIYRFRGADVHSYLTATAKTPDKQRHALGTNWRSDRSLVQAVQAVFAAVPDPFLNEQIRLTEVGAHYADRLLDEPALELTLVPRHPLAAADEPPKQELALQQVLPCVVDDIVAQLNDPPELDLGDGRRRSVVPGDVAVLCRTGVQLRQLQELLALRGVPAVLQTDESIFDTVEAQSVSHSLRALLNPGDLTLLTTALAGSLFGLTAPTLEELRRDERGCPSGASGLPGGSSCGTNAASSWPGGGCWTARRWSRAWRGRSRASGR